MPLMHDDSLRSGPTVVVRASVAVELEWALASAERADYRRDHAALAALYDDQSPELAERVRSFWGPDVAMSCGGFIELMVLAHHGGLLWSTDGAELLDRLGELCAAPPGEVTLGSETPDDRVAILGRLARLQASADLRGRYVELLTDVWTALRATWERYGRPSVDAAVAARRELLGRGASWVDVTSGGCDYGSLMSRLVDELGSGGVVAVVPAFFTHKGLLVELPGVVVVGVRTDPSGAEVRARTELLARRLKTIADPTRLAILDSLTASPRTVGEIATTFGLAQPTVSNHIKLMRDAGLVANATNGSRRDLVVQPDAVDELLDHLQSVLRRRAPAPPAQL